MVYLADLLGALKAEYKDKFEDEEEQLVENLISAFFGFA